MNRRVVVTDGEHRAALAVVRSLGRAGYEPIVVSNRPRPLAGASRFARRTHLVPDPLGRPREFTQAVRQIAADAGARVLIPTTEAAGLAILQERASFGDVVVPLPDHETFARVCDKQEVLRAAAEIGVRVPAQVVIRAPSDAARAALDELTYPVVLKPSRSVAGEVGRRVRQGVAYAASPDELRARLGALSPAAFPLLVQQRVVGAGAGIFALVWDGELLAFFSHRRLREKPPAGGVSVYAESVPADPALLEGSVRLLSHFGWQGVAMVEYKVEASTGTPFLMEVNGRFWGSLQLAVDAGVDFPTLLVRVATGERLAPRREYQVGVRTRWWWGDLDHVLARVRHRADDLALAPDAPGSLRVVADFLRWRRGDHNEVFRWDDPRPFVRESLQWVSQR